MSTQQLVSYSDTCASLSRAIQDYSGRISVSTNNVKLRETYTDKLSSMESNISLCNLLLDVLKPMTSDVQLYLAERKKEAMQNINNAIRLAGEIVQDAGEGVHFEIEGDDAWLATPDSLNVDTVEGGGFRHISSAFLRSVLLGSNPSFLKTMFLDEVFSVVSVTNSTALSLYLNVIFESMQVISIEQKPQVYSNNDLIAYIFNKVGEYSQVTRKDVKRGEFVSAIQND